MPHRPTKHGSTASSWLENLHCREWEGGGERGGEREREEREGEKGRGKREREIGGGRGKGERGERRERREGGRKEGREVSVQISFCFS